MEHWPTEPLEGNVATPKRRRMLRDLPDVELSGRTIIDGSGARINIAVDCEKTADGEHTCVQKRKGWAGLWEQWRCSACGKKFPVNVH